MDKLAKQEACQLFLEQEIETGLKEGKTPHALGKELTEWVYKLFKATVSPGTIKKKAQRQKAKMGTNVPSDTTAQDDSENEDNQVDQWICPVCKEEFRTKVTHCKYCDHHYPKEDGECSNCHHSLYHSKETVLRPDHAGGKREGAGPPIKSLMKEGFRDAQIEAIGEDIESEEIGTHGAHSLMRAVVRVNKNKKGGMPPQRKSNMERLKKHILSTAEGLNFLADGTLKPESEEDVTSLRIIRNAGPSIIAQYARMGINAEAVARLVSPGTRLAD